METQDDVTTHVDCTYYVGRKSKTSITSKTDPFLPTIKEEIEDTFPPTIKEEIKDISDLQTIKVESGNTEHLSPILEDPEDITFKCESQELQDQESVTSSMEALRVLDQWNSLILARLAEQQLEDLEACRNNIVRRSTRKRRPVRYCSCKDYNVIAIFVVTKEL